jgi:hypothetical protein
MKKQKVVVDTSSISKGAIIHSIEVRYIDLISDGGLTVFFPVPAKTAQLKGRLKIVDEYSEKS